MNKLQEWLDKHNMTQAHLAERMGVQREQVCRVCNGKPPSANFILAFWRATDASTTEAVFSESERV